jgi:mannosyltransferase
MKIADLVKKRENLFLLFILVVAFILRFFKLGHESFWLDELHTMADTNPSIPFSRLFHYLATSDLHPPLFFFFERFIFSIFGRSEVIGRFFPALAGVAGVWAMYLLGKEILNKNLGLIAAAFTSVNYFDLYYSREARPYTLLFLMTTFSFIFLIRLIKNGRSRDMWYYSLFALATMYTHYYGNFLVCSQFCVAFIFWLSSKDKPLYLKRFALSGLVIALGYIPWIPFFMNLSGIKTFWIESISQQFIFDYFNAYFGNSDFLKPLLVVLLVFYLINVLRSDRRKSGEHGSDPLVFSFILFSVSLVVTYTVPYIRSLLVVPMLFDRYTIVVLPIFLMAVAYGAELIADKLVKAVVFWIFIGWSLLYVGLTNNIYTTTHKTQFREMAAFMTADTIESQYPVLNERTPHQNRYYMDQFNYRGPVFEEPRASVIDSLVHSSSPKYKVNGFWLMDAHFASDPATYLDPKTRSEVDSSFVLMKQQRFYDAWAQLYLSKKSIAGRLTTADFPPGDIADVGGKVVAIWSGFVTSNPRALPAGDYTLNILARGTPAQQVYPHVIVAVNGTKVGDYYATGNFQDVQLPYRHTGADSVRVTIGYDNDFTDLKTGDDRNLFLQNIDFIKQ